MLGIRIRMDLYHFGIWILIRIRISVTSRIRIRINRFVQIRRKKGFASGSAKQDPYLDPRQSEKLDPDPHLHHIKIRIRINVMRIHNTAPWNDDLSCIPLHRRQRSAPFKSEATRSSPRDPQKFLLKQSY
jgi:hypothetical protein